MDYQIWFNGIFGPRSEAKISIEDRGFRTGDVVFDTSRTFNGTVFRLRDHLKRLYRSLQYVRIDPGLTIDEMEEITLEVVKRNESIREPSDDYMVTQMVTRGEGSFRITPGMKPNVIIWIDPIDFGHFAPKYESGAHVVIPRTRAYSSDQVDPKVKHYNRLNFALANLESSDVDPDSFPVLLDADGNLTESYGSNFLIVTDGVVRTPTDKSILQGVSRSVILELAEQLGIPVSYEDLQPYDAYTADEAFLCSTPYCILPVSRVDNRPIRNEVPGPITNQLLAAWGEMAGVDIVGQIIERAKRNV